MAAAELAVDQGCNEVKVRSLCRAAGVSTKTFYTHFSSVEACLISAYEYLVDYALAHASIEIPASTGSDSALKSTIRSLMGSVEFGPKASHFVLLEAADAGDGIRPAQELAAKKFEALLAAALTSGRDSVAPRHLMSALVAGVTRVARTTVLAGRADLLPAAADEICGWIDALSDPVLLRLCPPKPKAQSSRSADRPAPYPRRLETADGFAYGEVRTRVYNAVAKMVWEEGLAAVDGRRIRTEAGVSRREFDTKFAGVDQCLVTTVEAFATTAARQAAVSRVPAEDWGGWVHREVESLCATVARDRRLARRTVIGVRTAHREGMMGRDRLITYATRNVCACASGSVSTADLRMEASIAAVWSICECEIEAGRARELHNLAPLLAYLVLAPVVGPAPALKTTTAFYALQASRH